MYKHTNFFHISILLTCSIVLCSCLSINRNIKLNKDGSGSEVLSILFDKQFYQAMSSMASFMDSTRRQGFLDSLYSDEFFVNKSKEGYDSIHGVKLIDIYSEKGPDSSNIFVIKYEFDSVKKIGSALDQMNSDYDSSKTTVSMTNQESDVVFNYTYTQPNTEVLSANDSLSEQMKKGMAEIFGGDYINFEIEFPYPVISSNATSGDGNKLRWDYTISDIILNREMKLEAVMKK